VNTKKLIDLAISFFILNQFARAKEVQGDGSCSELKEMKLVKLIQSMTAYFKEADLKGR